MSDGRGQTGTDRTGAGKAPAGDGLPGQRLMRAAAWIALGVTAAAAVPLVVAGSSPAPALFPGALAGAAAYLVGRSRFAKAAEARPAAVPAPQTPPLDAGVAGLFGMAVILLDDRLAVRDFTGRAKELFPALERGRALAIALRDPDALALLERARLSDRDDAASGGRMDLAGDLAVADLAFRLHVRPFAVGETRLVAALLEDVTAQRATERMRADFVANASHELRTPLASLLGFIETLQGSARDDAAARERFLGVMRDQAGRMARVIDDLLSLSRAEQRAHQAPTGSVDLAEVARAMADAMAPLAREAGVALHVEVPSAPVTVRGDRDDIMRLSENLIQNAVKYGGEGGRVEIVVTQEASGGALAVRDHGRGVAPEHLPRLTERFYRVDASHSRATGGTGLGLAIVKHIAVRHGARLDIASRPGEGATFTVRFPAKGP